MKKSFSARRLAMLAMMLAMISVLAYLEHLLPPLPMLPPGVRLGLSNIVTLYALFFMGRRSALSLAVLKSGMVLLMRGVTAGLLSLCGGVCSVLVTVLLMALGRGRLSYLVLSIAGAITHNVVQLAVASLLLGTDLVFYYLPVILIFGTLMGSVTGVLLRVVMPIFDRISPR